MSTPTAIRKARARTQLTIFVSSPGDCEEERELVSEVADQISFDAEVRTAGVEFRTLRFEQLPGGPPVGDSAQARVFAALRRFGRHDYEVYLGAMKARVGTPTPLAASGTIEEFEDARKRHRRGRPSDVLFYFIGPSAFSADKDTHGVRSFRERLEREQFLYSRSADADAFRAQIEEHLRAIALHWNTPRRRFRRAIHGARKLALVAPFVLATVALVFLLAVDWPAERAILAAARSEDPAAILDAWTQRGHRMLVFREPARDAARKALERAISSDRPIESRLAAWTAWRASELAGGDEFERSKRSLSLAFAKSVDERATSSSRDDATALAASATVARLWNDDVGAERRALSAVAERVLVDRWVELAAVRDGQEVARPALADRATLLERAAIEARASRMAAVRVNKDVQARSSLPIAIAAAPVDRTASDALLEKLADDAWREIPGADMNAIVAFVRSASRVPVAGWVDARCRPDAKTYLMARIVEGVRAARDAGLALLLTDHFVAGTLPIDPFAFEDEEKDSFLGASTSSDASLREGLRTRFLARVAEAKWPSHWVAAAMLRTLDRIDDDVEREQVVQYLLKSTEEGGILEEAEVEVIDFLGRLGDRTAISPLSARAGVQVDGHVSSGRAQRAPLIQALIRGLRLLDAREFAAILGTRADLYVDGHVAGGWAQRAALIRALGRLDTPEFAAVALALARGARDEQERRLAPGKAEVFEDAPVQLAFLSSLMRVDAPTNETLEHLDRIITLRVRQRGPWFEFKLAPISFDPRAIEVDRELGRRLRGLRIDVLLSLFRFPAESNVLAELDGSWDRWLYLLECLEAADRDWPPELAQAVARNVPHDPKLGDRMLTWLAQRGGLTAREYFRQTLTVRPRSWLRYIALAGDVETFTWAAGHFEVASSSEASEFADWIAVLPDADRDKVLRWAVDRLSSSPVLLAELLPPATTRRFMEPRLVDSARLLLRPPYVEQFENVGVALSYLDAVEPAAIAAALDEPVLLDALRKTSDFGFTVALQSVDWSKQARLTHGLLDLARSRRVAIALEPRQLSEADVASGEYMDVGEQCIGSVFLAALGARTEHEALEVLLSLARESPQAVEGLVATGASADVFRAYALWQAARAIELGAPLPDDIWQRERWLDLLTSPTEALRRASAVFVLAMMRPRNVVR